jgi:uridine phosphorylase
MQADYPILEFDPAPDALLNPHTTLKPIDIAPHCVICFFQDVIERLVREHAARHVATLRTEIGKHPVYEITWNDQRLAVLHPGVGAPLAASFLEEAIAFGCQNFIVCGGAGVLVPDLAVGHVVVPTAAVRDEGTSYHYLPPAREVAAAPAAVAAIEAVLTARAVPYVLGKTWTTDAIYRETPAKIALRKTEGCLVVEMEAAALFAVARFRGVTLGQLLYSGDDLSGPEWDARGWTRHSSRETLFWLAAEACLQLPAASSEQRATSDER